MNIFRPNDKIYIVRMSFAFLSILYDNGLYNVYTQLACAVKVHGEPSFSRYKTCWCSTCVDKRCICKMLLLLHTFCTHNHFVIDYYQLLNLNYESYKVTAIFTERQNPWSIQGFTVHL